MSGGPAQVKLEGADLFKVELIDPWRMRVYPDGDPAEPLRKVEVLSPSP